jgi:hypothetical protein
LWTLADRHPGIAMARPVTPEPKFFLIDELYDRGLDYYAETWFNALPSGMLYGEKTTNYLESAVAAERIWRHLPEAKLVFLLRNPVDRAYSNFLWSRQNGLESETSFLRALELEEQREKTYPPAQRFSRPFSYFSRGLYAQHLQRFLERFPRDQILVLRTEDVIADARSVASEFHRFLGVDVLPDLAGDLGTINATGEYASLPNAVRTYLGERYHEPNRQLSALLGPEFRLWN